MKIIKLQAENVKRIKAVEIVPKDNMVVIAGKNEQGKTSVLDSIWWALGGERNIEKKPIREGEDKASIVLDLGEYKVTRIWTSNEKSYLKVETNDGAKFPSPQKLLDGLIGDLSFDPLAFSREDPKNQQIILLKIAGLMGMFNEYRKRRDMAYDERTIANRELKKIEGQLAGMRKPEGEPQEISIRDLTNKLNEANAERERQWKAHLQLESIENSIEAEKKAIAELEAALEKTKQNLERHTNNREQLEKEISAFKDQNIKEIQESITSAEETNRLVREAEEYCGKEKDLREKENEVKALSASIERLDKEKEDAVAKAKFPIDSLGFNEDGITYKGLPFEQAGSSVKIKVSMAIAMALSPKLRIIRVKDGNLLDGDNLKIVKEMVKDGDYQVWMEYVDSTGKIGVYIEDGMVKAVDGQKINENK